jgi:hypothetical protein
VSLQAASLEGIRVELAGPTPDSQALNVVTDATGHYEFTKLVPGTYKLRINQQGFRLYEQTVAVTSTTSSVADITMQLDVVTEKVEVKAQDQTLSSDQPAPSAAVNNEQLQSLPLTQQKFREALPLVPGVVRTQNGRLSVRGTSESQGMLEVDSEKTVDPVTGSFSIPVPIDAIQSVSVDKTPFSADKGGFSGGLTQIETTSPPTKWFYTIKDFNVSLRGKNDHIVGIAQATPRVAFGGPIDDGKFNFSEVFEYDVKRTPVRGLPWPRDEIKTQGFNSFTRMQAILSATHVINVDLNIFPSRTQFANITALIPQTASSDYNQKGLATGIVDQRSFESGALLRIAFHYTRFESNARGQGQQDMLITPESWSGNFFNAWNRSANQFQLNPTFQFAPKKWFGRHEVKVGSDVTHRYYTANTISHPVQLLREDGTIAETITFANNGLQNASATDVEEYVQDHWILNDRLAIDLGARVTSETLGRTGAFAPRFGFAYSPGKDQKTIFRGGAGLFYDRVTLLEGGFAEGPQRVVSFFDPTGNPIGTPLLYRNAYVGNGPGPISSRLENEPGTSPRSFVTNVEVDRQLWSGATLRVSYLYSQTRNLFAVNPLDNALGNVSLLGLFNTGGAAYHEFEATLHFQPVRRAEINASYIWSRSRGDLNTVSNIFLPFEQPVIRPNTWGILPSDIPNRFVSWGTVHLPWSIVVSPVVDVHTGFPYSNVDEVQNYVGIPNGQRFPTFFSFDGQVYRDFSFRLPLTKGNKTHKFRLGVYSVNLTNHGNFHDVYANVTSPLFGQFTGFQRRVDGFLLSFAP